MLKITTTAPNVAYDIAMIDGIFTPEDVEQFRALPQIHTLGLSSNREVSIENIAKAFKGTLVRSLHVNLSEGESVESIHLFEGVEVLRVWGLGAGILDLDRFPSITDYAPSFEGKGKHKAQINWGECLNLAQTGGMWSRLPSIEKLANFPKLKSLMVVKPEWEPEDLAQLLALQEIEFHYWQKITRLDQLKHPERLTKLHLSVSKNLTDYSALSTMKNLRSASFESCPEFPSVGVVDRLAELENFFLVDTKIRDGDTSSLLKHNKLRKIALKQQKHLKPSRDELDDHFMKMYGN